MVKYKNLLQVLAIFMMLASCSRNVPTINVVCEENSVGNSIVKWEILPSMDGVVKAYASASPQRNAENVPIAMAHISDSRMTIITPNPSRRYYYTLVFNDRYRVRVATRNVIIPGIQNFRDLGGYASHPNRKQVRWGHIYRSAAIDSLPSWSLSELKNIGIRTIIDLRTEDEKISPHLLDNHFHVVRIPIRIGRTEDLLQQIEQQKIGNEQVRHELEKMYTDIISQCSADFRHIFELLLNEENYPVVVHCAAGKGRIGVVSALILSALQVDESTVVSDYQLSNTYFDIRNASEVAYRLPSASQEAITSLYSARVDYLNASLRAIKKQYGDIQTYLREGIGLSREEIKKLQSLLLEKNNP